MNEPALVPPPSEQVTVWIWMGGGYGKRGEYVKRGGYSMRGGYVKRGYVNRGGYGMRGGYMCGERRIFFFTQ
jgi:hypothetical protein